MQEGKVAFDPAGHAVSVVVTNTAGGLTAGCVVTVAVAAGVVTEKENVATSPPKLPLKRIVAVPGPNKLLAAPGQSMEPLSAIAAMVVVMSALSRLQV